MIENTERQISIIIFGQNNNASINETIRNVIEAARNSYKIQYEIIIVDDGSEVPISLNEEFINLRIQIARHNTNQGIGDALLTGCNLAHYESVLFVPGHNFFSNEALHNVISLCSLAPIIIGYRVGMDNRPRIKRIGAGILRNFMRRSISPFIIDPHGLPIYPKSKVLLYLTKGKQHGLHVVLLKGFVKENIKMIQVPAPINPNYAESLTGGIGAYVRYFKNAIKIAKVALWS